MLLIIVILLILYLIFRDTPENFDIHEHFDEKQKEGIDLKNVNAITFSPHKYTTGNRTNPIPQLNCVGGNACDQSSIIKNIQCINKGTNDNDNDNVQWKCKAMLPHNYEISNTNVNCEGLSGGDDKIKLKGSCGLKYHLNNKNRNINRNKNTQNLDIFWIIFIVFLLFLIISLSGRYYYGGPYGMYYSPYYPPYYSPIIYGSPGYYNNSYSDSYSYSQPSSSFSTGFGETETR
jgi:hypothetical protein